MAEKNELTTKQIQAAAAMLGSANVPEAAKVAGCGERTLYRWLKDATFKAELDRQKAALVDQAGRRLAAELESAINTITSIMGDQDAPPAVRLRAADTILSNCLRLSELVDLERRLAELEKAATK